MAPWQHEELISRALASRQHAYSPYSNLCIGAAIRTKGGEIYSGSNVENSSYGLTICAERVAAAAAVAAGVREFDTLAVAGSGGCMPCGACRQFLAEFGDDLTILLVDADDVDYFKEIKLAALLPHRFQFPASGRSP